MLESRVLEFFSETCPVQPHDGLLVAVSGGSDSMALLHLLRSVRDSLGFTLDIAHIHHGIRGSSADEDAGFVASVAQDLGLPLHQRRVDVPALVEREGGSIETLARRERYAFLEEARAVAGARWIVTGHTADDQVETFLMNLLRGAGPRGLGGMLPVGPRAQCRPLLSTWREELIVYLEDNEIEYRTDPSNADLSHTRNRIRMNVVPHLVREFGDQVPRILARESQLMNELDAFLIEEGNRIVREALRPGEDGGSGTRLSARELAGHPRVLQRSAIRAAIGNLGGGLEEITLSHVDDVLDLIRSEEGSAEVHLPRGMIARREYGDLLLEPGSGPPSRIEGSPPIVLDQPGEIRWGPVHLRWRLAAGSEIDPMAWSEAPNRVCLDRAGLSDPLYLRGVQPGDRLEPFGMTGSQKVNELLSDRKVPRERRNRIGILCDNGGRAAGERILWVVGQRRSRFAPVGAETPQVVLFEAETIV